MATVLATRSKAFVGTGPQVAEKLHALARRLDLDELVINTWTHDPVPKHRSYELLADAFGLGGAVQAPPQRAGVTA
jgi:alkanesulfonate monooxygenase SsuD/methylene tetrahydromethanopterin reductase-like flavin-dependent oxidoreductase (luciferase family)